MSTVVPIVTNGRGIIGPIEGDHKLCIFMVCISKVGVTRACDLEMWQLVLGLLP